MSSISLQAWIPIWLLGAPPVLLALSAWFDGTRDRKDNAEPY